MKGECLDGGGVGVPSRIMRVLCHRHEEGRTSRAGSTTRVRRVTLKMVLVGTSRSPLTTLTAKNSRTDLKIKRIDQTRTYHILSEIFRGRPENPPKVSVTVFKTK